MISTSFERALDHAFTRVHGRGGSDRHLPARYCGKCGQHMHRDDSRTFRCPNGHVRFG